MVGGAPAPGAPPSLIAASFKGLCPQCGQQTLFAGTARFAPTCRACGLDFAAFNVGDGPAAFLILIVGAIVAVSAIVFDQVVSPRWWLHLVWLPVGLGLTLYGLRLGKAALLFQEWTVGHPGEMAADCSQQSEPSTSHRAREGRIVR